MPWFKFQLSLPPFKNREKADRKTELRKISIKSSQENVDMLFARVSFRSSVALYRVTIVKDIDPFDNALTEMKKSILICLLYSMSTFL